MLWRDNEPGSRRRDRSGWRRWTGALVTAAVVAVAVAVVVVGGGGDDEPTTTSDEEGQPASANQAQPAGAWSAGGRWAVARDHDSTAVGLADGRVLVAGGSVARSAEVWDPDSRRSRLVGELAEPRRGGHTATRLVDGRVLVAGGSGGQASAEIYDPDGDQWQAVAAMDEGRGGHTATRLADGRVLVAGGTNRDGVPLASAEVYDPEADDWVAVGEMGQPRSGHTAARLTDEGVLVVGGVDGAGEPLASTERFDSDTDEWSRVAPMAAPRARHATVRLADGRVLAVGGDDVDGEPLAAVEAYRPGEQRWVPVAPMATPRAGLSATRLADDTVLAVGGETAERYDPAADAWWEAAAPQQFHSDHIAIRLASGDVVMAASKGSGAVAEVYRPRPVAAPSVTGVSPEQGSVAGGWELTVEGEHIADVVFVDVGAHRLRDVTVVSPQQLRLRIPAQPAGSAPVTVTTPGGTSDPVELTVTADDGQWQPAGEMDRPRLRAGIAVLDGPACDGEGSPAYCGQLLVVGRETSEHYDPDDDQFTAVAGLPEAMASAGLDAGGRTSRLGGPACAGAAPPDYCGRVLVLDQDSAPTAAVYEPQTGQWHACDEEGGLACPPSGEQPDSNFDYRWSHTVRLDGPACRGDAPPDHCGNVLALRTLAGRPPEAWRYQPATGEWSQLASPSERREQFAATLVDGEVCERADPPPACGQILIAGGTAFEPGRAVRAETAELYDPAADQWRDTAEAPQPGRAHPAAARLPDGRALLAGGYLDPEAADTVELFDPDGETWQPQPALPQPRQNHAAVALADGRVLVAGGKTPSPAGEPTKGEAAGSALIWTPDTGEWAYTASLAHPRHGGRGAQLLSAEALPDGTALVIGGRNIDGVHATAERYHPTSD